MSIASAAPGPRDGQSPSASGERWGHRKRLVCLLLLATILLYSRCLFNDFINYDDPTYVTQNLHTQAGITRATAVWAFTRLDDANWFPVTLLSHALDCQLYGLWPPGHHLTSVLLHAVNVVLVFLVLESATGSRLPSLVAATLFAVHPLRVESVAWIAERKDVLSALFFLLCVGAYLGYVKRPHASRYAVLLLVYLLALASKPMAVTLPFALLLLDYWPLKRFRNEAHGRPATALQQKSPLQLASEKLPLAMMALATSAVTVIAQIRSGAITPMSRYPLTERLNNAMISYCRYLFKFVWPTRLAIHYPIPPHWPLPKVLGAAIGFAALSALFIGQRKRRPYLFVGWLWFVGLLVPVIGIVQAGSQALADRFLYLPGLGLLIIIAWSADEWSGASDCRRKALMIATAVLAVALSAATWRQIGLWHDDYAIFDHALNVTDDNWLAHCHVADRLAKDGRIGDAEAHYARALRIRRVIPDAESAWGTLLLRQGEFPEAVEHFRHALQTAPSYYQARYNLGVALANQGEFGAAAEEFGHTVQLFPHDAAAECALATAYLKLHQYDDALTHYDRALQMDPLLKRAERGRVECADALLARQRQ